MSKIDNKLISQYYPVLMAACVDNAKELNQEAKLLLRNGACSRAFFLAYCGLEELAKAALLHEGGSNTSKMNSLTLHEMKIPEIVKLIENFADAKFKTSEKPRLEKRLKQMREDALYVRLKSTPGDNYKPDNNYWKKRAKIFSAYLDLNLKKLQITIVL